MVDGDIAAQTARVLQNIGALLDAAGLTHADVVRTTVFLADMNDFKAMNEAYARFFTEPYPARSTVQAARLPRDARIEIDAIAVFDGVELRRTMKDWKPSAVPAESFVVLLLSSKFRSSSGPLDADHTLRRRAAT